MIATPLKTLEAEIATLRRRVARLADEAAELRDENAALRDELDEYRPAPVILHGPRHAQQSSPAEDPAVTAIARELLAEMARNAARKSIA